MYWIGDFYRKSLGTRHVQKDTGVTLLTMHVQQLKASEPLSPWSMRKNEKYFPHININTAGWTVTQYDYYEQ